MGSEDVKAVYVLRLHWVNVYIPTLKASLRTQGIKSRFVYSYMSNLESFSKESWKYANVIASALLK